MTASTVSLSDRPCKRLQRDHRRHHIGGHARPAPTRREQVREHLIGKQLPPMRSQERKHTARLEQMPRYRLRIQQLTLIIRSTLHPKIIPKIAINRPTATRIIQGIPSPAVTDRNAPASAARTSTRGVWKFRRLANVLRDNRFQNSANARNALFFNAGTSRYVFTTDVSVNEVQAFIGDLVPVIGFRFTRLHRCGASSTRFKKPSIYCVDQRRAPNPRRNEGSPVGLGDLVEHPPLEIRVAAVQDCEIALIHAHRLRIDFFLFDISGITQ